MKFNRKNLLLTSSAVITLTLTAPSAFAVPYYWDINGATSGAGGATPSGTWATGGLTWSADSNGATATSAVTTLATDDLTFSAGSDATGTYAITLGAGQNARSLTFEDGNATIGTVGGANTLTLTGGGITVLTGSGNGTVSCSLTINGGNTFNVESGRTLTVNGTTFTRGTRASLNVQGNGTVAAPVANGTLGTALSGTIAPWASFGTGTSMQYATISGGNIVGFTGTAAATAGNVTDTTGTIDYDVADLGTVGANASVNTLRYTGSTTGNITGDLATKGIMNAGEGNLTFAGAVTAGNNTTEMVINTANAGITFSSTLTGRINKTGSGTMTLTNAVNRNTDINAITVNQGILITSSANSANATDAAMVGATINSGGTLRWGGGNRHSNGAVFTINAGGTLDLNAQGDLIGGLSGAGSVITTGAPTFQLGSAGNLTFSGVMSGGLSLIKRNGGDQILTGANTFTGTTHVLNASATLTLGNPLALQNSALDTSNSIPGNGTTGLRTTVTTLTLGGLTGNSTVITNLADLFRTDATGGPSGNTAQGGYAGVTSLTLNPAANVTRTYFGTIADGAASMTLTKSGAGTQVLSGNNTYTGGTNVANGTLRLTGSGRLGNGTYAGNLSIASGATFDNQVSTQTLTGIVGTGGGTVSNTAGLILQNANNAYGTLNITAGRVFIQSNAGALAANSTVNISGGRLVTEVVSTYNQAITITSGGISARQASIFGNVTLPGNGTVTLNNDDQATSTLTITNNQVLDGNLNVTVGGTNATIGNATLFGNISGAAGSLTKSGSGNQTGRLILTGTNTYSGNTTVNFGTLSLGNGTTHTSLADTAGVEIGTDPTAVLDLNYSGTDSVASLTIAGVVQIPGVYGSSDPSGRITGNGTLTVGVVSAPYTTWPGGNSTNFYADANGDGVPNGMTWLLGGINATSNGLLLLPAPVVSGGNMTLSFKTPTPTAPAKLFFEYGNNLVGWTPVQVPAANATVGSVTFTVTPANGTTNNVTLTVNGNASVGGKLFGRFNSQQ